MRWWGPVAAGGGLQGVLPGGEQNQTDPETHHQITHNLSLEVSCTRNHPTYTTCMNDPFTLLYAQ